jgi:HEAT repeat protein
MFDEDAINRARAKAVGGTEEQTTVPFNTILEWLKDPDWHKRMLAIQELNISEETIALLTGALDDENPQVRRLAAAALGTTGSANAVPALCNAVLNDKSVGVRRTAGDALSDIGDPSAQPAMWQALADANKLVRWRAARFLFDIGTEEALPYLADAVSDSEFEVRLEVEAAIERIKGGLQGIGPAWRRIVDGQ